MTPKNILHITDRGHFRQWLIENHETEKECWVAVKKGNTPPADALWYLDAVEEAICFGWIDSTLKNVDGVSLQRFSPRTEKGNWTELNKERYRRLEKIGLMTDSGRKTNPDAKEKFKIMPQITRAFKRNPTAWKNFQAMPELYRRVRIYNIQSISDKPDQFRRRLKKLIEASERNEMIGDWHDFGRLLNY